MLRLGIVDFDSSHSIEFTRRFNHVDMSSEQCVDGARVVLGCPGTSDMSPERISRFTEQIRTCGVDLVEKPEAMIGRIDAVLVLSLCGSAHWPGVKPFLEAGIAAYVDKPFACSIDDATAMIRTANENDVLLYHSSALPFSAEVGRFQQRSEQTGDVHGVVSFGPAKRAAGNPGLFHYGIHAVALLFALMGTRCTSVTNTFVDNAEVVTGRWSDGRIATLRGNRQGKTSYGFTAFCENGVFHESVSTQFAYRNLCQSIVTALETGIPPVSHERNLAEVRFVLAAMESERHNGKLIELDSVT